MDRLRYALGISASLGLTMAGYALALAGGGILAIMGLYGEIFGAKVHFSGNVPVVERDPLIILLSWLLGFAMLGAGTVTMSHALRSLFIRLESGRREAGHFADVEGADDMIRQLAAKLSRARPQSRRPA